MEILIILGVILFVLILGWMLRGSSNTPSPLVLDLIGDIAEAICSAIGSISSDDGDS